jgi:hypothetical protein
LLKYSFPLVAIGIAYGEASASYVIAAGQLRVSESGTLVSSPRRQPKIKPRGREIPSENNFVGEQRDPFLGLGKITFTSTHQFMLSVSPLYQPGVSEVVDDFAFVALVELRGRSVFEAVAFIARNAKIRSANKME